ncbi:MAG: tetratricopeptide repeat-containing glycosyltransferase family protein [Bradyrhizobium sp.]
MNRRDRRAGARKAPTTSSRPGAAATPASLHEAGLRHLRAGRHLDAQICCQQALAMDSGHADSLHLMGLLSSQSGQYDHAAEWLVRAIRQDPRPEFLASLGLALRQQGRNEEAFKVFDKALQLKPREWDVARECGIALHQVGRLEDAHAWFDLCNEIRPDDFASLHLRSRNLFELGRFEEALADARQAHRLDPAEPGICSHIGVILRSLSRNEEALPWYDRALALAPNSVDALNNKALLLSQMHRFDEAFATYGRAKALAPDNVEVEWNLGHLQMLTGNFEAGWTGLEARWKRAAGPIYPPFTQPKWLGEGPVEGKTVLVCSDEGLGDFIQFARYIPMLAARGARVILFVPDAIAALVAGLPGVSGCFAFSGRTLPAFDMHCPVSSLPLAFGTRLDSIPAATSYLPRPAEARVQAWEDRLGTHDRLRVGLVWAGNPNHKNDRNRSIPLRLLTRILDVGATFVSLQKDVRPSDKAVLDERSDIVDLIAHLTDFTETAALIGCLDLVITVDTSVAHLAGSLGCPTWIVLPYTPDYRWLLDRDDSPWYPTVRLFRQNQTRDYEMVLDRVRSELLALIAK